MLKELTTKLSETTGLRVRGRISAFKKAQLALSEQTTFTEYLRDIIYGSK